MQNNSLEVNSRSISKSSGKNTLLGVNLREVSPQRRKFLKKYVQCLNATEAARHAYPKAKESSLAVIGSQCLRSLKVTLDEILELHGITDDAIAKAFHGGLYADKVELGRFEGKITDEKVYADLPTRKTYLELLLKMTGRLNEGINVNQFIDARRFDGEPPGDYIRRTLSEIPPSAT